jgi:hypothetical protein
MACDPGSKLTAVYQSHVHTTVPVDVSLPRVIVHSCEAAGILIGRASVSADAVFVALLSWGIHPANDHEFFFVMSSIGSVADFRTDILGG